MNAHGVRFGLTFPATQEASVRGGGEGRSGTKEVCGNNGAVAKLCDGISPGTSGTHVIINAPAKWHNMQCPQDPDEWSPVAVSAL